MESAEKYYKSGAVKFVVLAAAKANERAENYYSSDGVTAAPPHKSDAIYYENNYQEEHEARGQGG